MTSLRQCSFLLGFLLAMTVCTCAKQVQAQDLTHSTHRERLPDESELKSAYCNAVIKKQLSAIKVEISPQPQSPASTDNAVLNDALRALQLSMQRQTKILQDNLNRVQLYLLPRLKYLDSDAILAAHRRGEVDFQRQRDTGAAAKCRSECSDLMETSNQCLAECMRRDPLNKRIFQCRDLDFLPY